MNPPFQLPPEGSYIEGPPRQVPGFHALHRMVSMLLAERTPTNARILVLGAGGGLELKSLAEAHPTWTFDGVDPSGDMLRRAELTVGTLAARMRFHEGYIATAPEGPFDAATCLLTFHFIPRNQRLDTLQQIRLRLKPGAPFALAHISFPQTEPERSQWITRHVAWGAPDGTDAAELIAKGHAIATRLTILAPEEEQAMLREAGFSAVTQFYAALSFRGWVSYA